MYWEGGFLRIALFRGPDLESAWARRVVVARPMADRVCLHRERRAKASRRRAGQLLAAVGRPTRNQQPQGLLSLPLSIARLRRPGSRHTSILASNVMRHIFFAIANIVLAAPAPEQDPAGISLSVVSRCAGKVGNGHAPVCSGLRSIVLDGMPKDRFEELTRKAI